MKMEPITYSKLSAKQQETYNFHVVARELAEYGFNSIKLSDDWEGADFLAYHNDGVTTLKVQLKGRIKINKKYCDKEIYIAFPSNDTWYLVPHDELVKIVGEVTPWLCSKSWAEGGHYSSKNVPKKVLERLHSYALPWLGN